jgi:hypothetical protein
VSILRDRIAREDYMAGPELHPWGTAATPMIMPMGVHLYDGDTVLYGTAHPLTTADGAVVPASGNVTYPAPVPAGRP